MSDARKLSIDLAKRSFQACATDRAGSALTFAASVRCRVSNQ